jgi:hypothetical protein
VAFSGLVLETPLRAPSALCGTSVRKAIDIRAVVD